ncbi:DUF2155 domain-containing protein [Roseomonas sp. SSH11]|uniref:DUF2155 domain-containing protein n=1 Tax=Pararoseomonas baculiformis TaxID=2820812 RepID=A0ABS4AKQ3_9PROT|nr:DUF2155 domain-containing protein [Pararoseomonas baculiformis]MBP0446769.1 DUF2155 domain-containing protein [Pararoseomonas baculiformis]
MRRAAFLLLLALGGPALAQGAGQGAGQGPPSEPGWVRKRGAQLQALDKVTARITVLEANVGQPVRFGTLTVTVQACNARPPDEVPDAAAFMEVRDSLAGDNAAPVFRGWMLANAPAANMLEHPVYDLRILDCR